MGTIPAIATTEPAIARSRRTARAKHSDSGTESACARACACARKPIGIPADSGAASCPLRRAPPKSVPLPRGPGPRDRLRPRGRPRAPSPVAYATTEGSTGFKGKESGKIRITQVIWSYYGPGAGEGCRTDSTRRRALGRNGSTCRQYPYGRVPRGWTFNPHPT